jgi:all-trans-retinol 13,14-reductase
VLLKNILRFLHSLLAARSFIKVKTIGLKGNEMGKYDFLIIGSGLGGLSCGYILSKEGYNVCIVEKNKQIGGCLQSFTRDECIFDTGVHYIGSLDQGQILYKYFKYFGLIDKIKVKRLDENSFDKISFDCTGEEYCYGMGNNNFVEILSKKFPNSKSELEQYIATMKNICDAFDLYNLRRSAIRLFEKPFIKLNTYDFLKSITKDVKLQNVLAGINPLYAGVAESSPLYIHSLSAYSYIQSAYRLVDGSTQIVNILTQAILENGGTILNEYEAQRLVCDDDKVIRADFSNNEVIEAKNFISNIHPINTIKMVSLNKFRKAYRDRVNSLENTISTFTLYITFKKESFKYYNNNFYWYKKLNVWTADSSTKEDWPESMFYFTPASSKSPEYAESMIVMTYMKFDEVRKWKDTTVGKRGAEYEDFKRMKAEIILNILQNKYPNFRSQIKSVYSSSPLTYRDYTGTIDGSLYGIIRASNEPYRTYISHKTKIPNLYLTGQNIIMHGVLGVIIGAIISCHDFVGMDYLTDKIKSVQ